MQSQRTAIVLDGQPFVAYGIAGYLKSHCGFTAAYTLANAQDLWAYLETATPPLLAIIDFWNQDGATLSIMKRLRVQCPQTRQLVMSANDDQSIQQQVCASGADGFLNKQQSTEVFRQTVLSVCHDQTDTKTQVDSFCPQQNGLTTRQTQVLALLMQGMPNKRIAQGLSLSEATVKEHVSAIFGKLQVTSRMQVITKLHEKVFLHPMT